MLRRRLTAAAESQPGCIGRLAWRWRVAASATLLAVLLVGGAFWKGYRQQSTTVESGVVPNPRLTPGEATSALKTEVCQTKLSGETLKISNDMREAVFSAYGMKDVPRDAYEVDFLITPELGGVASIRNLWPEPYHREAWNAHTKDRLEDRLRSLVCGGELDLATAQQEIASNWVRAYRKYVETDHPI